jgi:hypothetical protein
MMRGSQGRIRADCDPTTLAGIGGATLRIPLKRRFLGQPMRSKCSSRNIGQDRMPRRQNIDRGIFGTLWIATVPAIVVLSLLVGQNVRIEFPQASSVRQCSISSGSAHGQTQRFYPDGVQWTAPVGTFVILPFRGAGSASWNFIQRLFPAIQTKGFRFNRPPPTY